MWPFSSYSLIMTIKTERGKLSFSEPGASNGWFTKKLDLPHFGHKTGPTKVSYQNVAFTVSPGLYVKQYKEASLCSIFITKWDLHNCIVKFTLFSNMWWKPWLPLVRQVFQWIMSYILSSWMRGQEKGKLTNKVGRGVTNNKVCQQDQYQQ